MVALPKRTIAERVELDILLSIISQVESWTPHMANPNKLVIMQLLMIAFECPSANIAPPISRLSSATLL